jgi:hypothetical protein
VTELLGQSLYDILKKNNHRGYPMGLIRDISRSSLLSLSLAPPLTSLPSSPSLSSQTAPGSVGLLPIDPSHPHWSSFFHRHSPQPSPLSPPPPPSSLHRLVPSSDLKVENILFVSPCVRHEDGTFLPSPSSRIKGQMLSSQLSRLLVSLTLSLLSLSLSLSPLSLSVSLALSLCLSLSLSLSLSLALSQ